MKTLSAIKLAARKVLSPFARKILGQQEWVSLNCREVNGLSVVHRRCHADEETIDQMSNDIFLAAIPEYIPRRGDIILDVGAHIGSFAMNAAAQGATVYAVEARRETFELLQINARINRLTSIRPHHLALSDRDGTCQLYYSWSGNWGDSIVDETTVGSETVACQTLTSFMDGQGIARCDLLKSNCEGAEFRLLLSTPEAVLARIRRMIVLYHCDLDKSQTPEALVSHLRQSGFSTRLSNQDSHRGWIIATQEHGTSSMA
jgi:FkbM family methyltransferase